MRHGCCSCTTTAGVGELRLALADIRVRENVRDLDVERVDKLALRWSPAITASLPADSPGSQTRGWWCVVTKARRLTAPRRNVTLKQLAPLKDAQAVQAMLDEAYTMDGAAQTLGWSRQIVTA